MTIVIYENFSNKLAQHSLSLKLFIPKHFDSVTLILLNLTCINVILILPVMHVSNGFSAFEHFRLQFSDLDLFVFTKFGLEF